MAQKHDAFLQHMKEFTTAAQGVFWVDFISPWAALDMLDEGGDYNRRLLLAAELTLDSYRQRPRPCLLCETVIGRSAETVAMIAVAHLQLDGTPAVGMALCSSCLRRGVETVKTGAVARLRQIWPNLHCTDRLDS